MWSSSGISTRTFIIFHLLYPLSNIISKIPNITYHIYSEDKQLIKIPVNSLNSNLELLKCASEIINSFLETIY